MFSKSGVFSCGDRCFTLIGLLGVTATIAILAFLLFPRPVERGRGQGKYAGWYSASNTKKLFVYKY